MHRIRLQSPEKYTKGARGRSTGEVNGRGKDAQTDGPQTRDRCHAHIPTRLDGVAKLNPMRDASVAQVQNDPQPATKAARAALRVGLGRMASVAAGSAGW